MSFSGACPVAFRRLTKLTLDDLGFGHSQVTDLITSCDRLKRLVLGFCWLVDQSALKIDSPHFGIQELEFYYFVCTRIELVSVPKLRKVRCKSWPCENPPVRFGYVPKLHDITLRAIAKAWQAPFALSECLPRSVRNLSNLCLRMIWIQPEHPKHLTATFRNLTSVALISIFPECDLSWTCLSLRLHLPCRISVIVFHRNQSYRKSIVQFHRKNKNEVELHGKILAGRMSCLETGLHVSTFPRTAEKSTVVWELSKDLKHLNLKLLQIFGFEEEDKVTNYIRLVMERVVGLKRIKLRGELPCKKWDAIDPRRSQVDEARRIRIKE